MERYLKYSTEEKINAIKESLDGKESMSSIAKRYLKIEKEEKEQAVVAYLLTYRYLQKI